MRKRIPTIIVSVLASALLVTALFLLLGSGHTKAAPVFPRAVAARQADDIELSPGYRQEAEPGTVVIYTHVLTNTGDTVEVVILEAASSHGWPVALLGGMYLTGTLHLPLSLTRGMTATVQVSLTVPATALGGTVDSTVLTATLLPNSGVWTTVDTTTVKHVKLSPGYSQEDEPGAVVTYIHTLTNTGTTSDAFHLQATNSRGWTVALRGGDWPTGTAQFPLRVNVSGGATDIFTLNVTIPPTALQNTAAKTYVTATSQATPTVSAAVTDITTVRQIAGVELSSGYSQTVEPDTIVTYTHILTNTGNSSDTFALSHHSSQNWTVKHAPAIALGWGEATTFVVSVTVPSGTSGLTDVTMITATSQWNDDAWATVTDTTTVRWAPRYILLPLVARYWAPWYQYDLYEPNDTPAQALAWDSLESGESYQAYIWDATDRDDYYHFTPSSAITVEIELTNIPSNCDYDLYVYYYERQYYTEAQSNQPGNTDESVTFTSVAGRTYYIRVYPYNGFSSQQPYSLRATYR